ncbi:hypothetical protein EYZ11_004214 [Aspergillus tanneri]|uniref:Uncharacterized protein n=1 Tax=Aspergillus tanneri TaxID=1220188 RepID=A0A4S3JL27_9EURO|nr:hypothetical protein EYZ11_004214 [Aspergillus tanneri]
MSQQILNAGGRTYEESDMIFWSWVINWPSPIIIAEGVVAFTLEEDKTLDHERPLDEVSVETHTMVIIEIDTSKIPLWRNFGTRASQILSECGGFILPFWKPNT